MCDLQEEVINIKTFFKNAHIPLSDEWIESCIRWYKEQQAAPYTEKQLQSVIYDQWLSFDLREIALPQLPANIENVTKLVLNKTFALQVMCVIDISKPKLQQLNKIKNANPLTRGIDDDATTNNTFVDNFTAKSLLQLTLTDGVQEIKAMEYKPIPCLNLNLTPGIKVKINGPVTIRRGTMLLEPHHVKLLGGEVEEILVCNAVENVLSRFLNLPENPNPTTTNDSINELKTPNVHLSNANLKQNCNPNKNLVQNNVPNHFVSNSQPSTSTTAVTDTWNNRAKKSFNSNAFIDEEEELRISREVDSLLEAEQELLESINPISKPALLKTNNSVKQDYISNEDELGMSEHIDMLLEIERDLLAETTKKTCLKMTHKNSNYPDVSGDRKAPEENTPPTLLPSDLVDLEEGLFAGINIGEVPNKNKIYTLGEVKQAIKEKRAGKYTTFAKFKSVVEKLTVNSEGWRLQISIESENDELTVQMHTIVVTEMIGYSPEEVMEMKKNIQKKDAETANTIIKAIDGLRLRLLELNCLIEIEYKGENNIPCVIKLL